MDFSSIPIVTKVYLIAIGTILLVTQLKFINPFMLIFIPKAIVDGFEFWRLFTSFLYVGPLGFGTIIVLFTAYVLF
jgi:Derlin-2/3